MLIALAVALPACGGDDGGGTPSAREQVRAAAERVLATSDAELFCTRLVTQRLLDDVFLGERKVCVKAPANQEEDDGPTKSAVTSVDVRGDRATVELRSKADGEPAGSHEYARERGRWKLDRFGDAYIDRVFALGLEVAGGGRRPCPRCARV